LVLALSFLSSFWLFSGEQNQILLPTSKINLDLCSVVST
jgi:hypothetical protein